MSNVIAHNNDLYLSADYLATTTGVSSGYLRLAKSRARQGAQSWQWQEVHGKTYFAYSSLPASTLQRLPAAAALAQLAGEHHNAVDTIIDAVTYTRYRAWMPEAGGQEDLAKAMALVHEAAAYCKANNVPYSKSPFFKELAGAAATSGMGKYLPATWRNLRDKIQEYAHTAEVNVKQKNIGNTNRAIHCKNEQIKNWLLELGESKKNFSYAFIHRKVRALCAQNGIAQAPSPRWISTYMAQPGVQYLVNQRHGSNSRFNSKHTAYVPTLPAVYAGDCWDIDGTRVQIIDHKAVVQKGNRKVMASKFLYIVVVRDVMSGMPLGWEYCYEESADVIINALAMAVRNSGYVPYELRYDKFPGHNSADWAWVEDGLRNMGVKLTQTVKAQGKAHIERWWGTLQSVFMAESDYYYGEGIRSTRRYAHRAKEYIAEMRKKAHAQGFNFDQACEETDRILHAYATTKYSAYSRKHAALDQSPLQLHTECTKVNTKQVDEAQFCYLFGLRKHLSVRSHMIQTQIAGAHYFYGIDDVEVIEKYTGVKLLCCFDYECLNRVHVYEGSTPLGTFDMLTPAQQYGPDKDMRAVGKMKAIATQVEEHRTAKLAQARQDALIADAGSLPDLALLGGRISKSDFEAAETAALAEAWADDEGDLQVNTRKMY